MLIAVAKPQRRIPKDIVHLLKGYLAKRLTAEQLKENLPAVYLNGPFVSYWKKKMNAYIRYHRQFKTGQRHEKHDVLTVDKPLAIYTSWGEEVS